MSVASLLHCTTSLFILCSSLFILCSCWFLKHLRCSVLFLTCYLQYSLLFLHGWYRTKRTPIPSTLAYMCAAWSMIRSRSPWFWSWCWNMWRWTASILKASTGSLAQLTAWRSSGNFWKLVRLWASLCVSRLASLTVSCLIAIMKQGFSFLILFFLNHFRWQLIQCNFFNMSYISSSKYALRIVALVWEVF